MLLVAIQSQNSKCGHPKSSQKKADDVNNYLCYLWPLKIKKWPSKQTKKIDARIVGQTRPSKQLFHVPDRSVPHTPPLYITGRGNQQHNYTNIEDEYQP